MTSNCLTNATSITSIMFDKTNLDEFQYETSGFPYNLASVEFKDQTLTFPPPIDFNAMTLEFNKTISNPNEIYANTYCCDGYTELVSVFSDGFYYRTFGDSKWIKIPVTQEFVSFVNTFEMNNQRVFVIGTELHLYVSYDSCLTWELTYTSSNYRTLKFCYWNQYLQAAILGTYNGGVLWTTDLKNINLLVYNGAWTFMVHGNILGNYLYYSSGEKGMNRIESKTNITRLRDDTKGIAVNENNRLFMGDLSYSDDFGTTWTYNNQFSLSGGSIGINAIRNVVIATGIGMNGVIYLSKDYGETYAEIDTGINAEIYNVNFVDKGNSFRVVFSTSNGLYWKDYDLLNLSFTKLSFTKSEPFGIGTDGKGKWVVGSNNSSAIHFSNDDGLTWSEASTPVDKWIRDVAYGNGTFVICGDYTQIYSSTDMNTWTSSGYRSRWNACAYGNGVWVFGTHDWSGISYSSDLNTFTSSNINSSSTSCRKVIFANNEFVAIEYQKLYRSTDGSNWTLIRTIPGSSSESLCYGGGYYIVCLNTCIIVSKDLSTWNEYMTGYNWRTCAYGNNKWIIINNNGEVYVSLDCMNFSLVYNVTPSNDVWTKFGKNHFVIMVFSGEFYISN
ncbi:BNR/Asp-box repeat family protein [Trichomonas vaginalis G3]|uniref:BNR/Asp-box repeat family protein n=1 Tax=Trichomonas vaginalis (strain ATCC PRA-98 / G3) TaxID=412133 RepID=A2G365_TRIV3|nr:oligoxyloglucan reducing end-specific cellobiohydrolase family [Trichomonas vaginalis G3]EAX88402.1 BNR/Asp-box repeat family protein [Trichomonas vaginalis G3]KAI5494579.1 oligoxyloglucan reducing end-specific cellobiohydrolase family [Trichomonas vaginalis G3]|eukprot:XP_001301332.1 BNR/Asp-box repeat family protein [Trichomonas vaginalis G3]